MRRWSASSTSSRAIDSRSRPEAMRAATSRALRASRASPPARSARASRASSSMPSTTSARPRSPSATARSTSSATSAGPRLSSRKRVLRLMSGLLTSKNGFSVVAPTRITVPCSTPGSRASCCDFVNRWISSRKSTVRRSSSSSRRVAVASTPRTSLTPALTADSCSKAASVSSATSRASVVLPVPGGPQRIIDTGRPRRTISPKAAPGSRRCGWPTTSSRDRGRIRAGNGSAARRRSSRWPAKRSSWLTRRRRARRRRCRARCARGRRRPLRRGARGPRGGGRCRVRGAARRRRAPATGSSDRVPTASSGTG